MWASSLEKVYIYKIKIKSSENRQLFQMLPSIMCSISDWYFLILIMMIHYAYYDFEPYSLCHLNRLFPAWYFCLRDLFIRWYIDLPYYKFVQVLFQIVVQDAFLIFVRFSFTCSVDDGFPAVTFYFENSLSLNVYPHDYLFPSVSIMNWKHYHPFSIHISSGPN